MGVIVPATSRDDARLEGRPLVVAPGRSRASSERPTERSVIMAGGIGKLGNGSVSWRALWRSRVLTAAAVSVVLAVGLFAQPVAGATTRMTPNPNTRPPTTNVTVTGTGFGVTKMVTVDFGAAQVATATTDSAGT